MKWSDYHAQSERLAIEAELSIKRGNRDSAINFYRESGEREYLAFGLIDKEKARTRGIIAISTVALFYKAAEYDLAEKLAYSLLADDHIPPFAKDELRNLVQAIWTESSKRKANVSFIPGQVLVSVKGGDVVTGGAPLDLIVNKIQTIQSMFYRTIEFLNGLPHRREGPPSKEIQEACRPWLFQSPPGSYQFAVAIQKPAQPDFFKEDVDPEEIAQHFLRIVSASSSEDDQKLGALVPDQSYKKTFLKLTRNLAPTGKSYERIELRSSSDMKPVCLLPDSRTNISGKLKGQEILETDQAVEEDLRGVLRALHLDKDWLDILVDGSSVHVTDVQDAVDDVIGPMVNRPVIVKVLKIAKKRKNVYKFVDIELAE